jgi:hypothetical protein
LSLGLTISEYPVEVGDEGHSDLSDDQSFRCAIRQRHPVDATADVGLRQAVGSQRQLEAVGLLGVVVSDLGPSPVLVLQIPLDGGVGIGGSFGLDHERISRG